MLVCAFGIGIGIAIGIGIGIGFGIDFGIGIGIGIGIGFGLGQSALSPVAHSIRIQLFQPQRDRDVGSKAGGEQGKAEVGDPGLRVGGEASDKNTVSGERKKK